MCSGVRAEGVLGEGLQGRPSDASVLAMKPMGAMSDDDKGLSREQVFKQIDASLARLQTDHVDLYQCHRYDWAFPASEARGGVGGRGGEGKVTLV